MNNASSRVPLIALLTLDITHDLSPRDIVGGALTLSAVTPWIPAGAIVVGVVDPGVGTSRAPVAARLAQAG